MPPQEQDSQRQDDAGPAPNDLRKSILTLGFVNAFDMVVQFLLPVLLAKLLPALVFGEYRALWLIAATATAVLPMAIPNSLYYFLPRSSAQDKATYLAQSTLFMAVAGGAAGLAALIPSVSKPFNPSELWLVASFLALWIFSGLLDVLCNALQQTRQQAIINISLSFLRLALVAGSAVWSQSATVVLIAHLLLSVVKAATCLVMVWHHTRGHRLNLSNSETWSHQLRYTLPFGASAALYGLRSRLDQWVVVSMFSTAAYGVYSVASVFSPIQGLIRSTVTSVLLPELNRLHGNEGQSRMHEINGRGNIAVAALMFPTLAYIAASSDQLLAFLFSKDYQAAANVVRIYTLVLLVECIEVTTLMTALRQGPFLMRVDVLMLAITLACSAAGAALFGITGTALGGLAAALAAQGLLFRQFSKIAGVPMTRVQPWAELGRLLLAALISGAMAALLLLALAGSSLLIRLGTSAIGFTVAYWALVQMMGLRHVLVSTLGSKLSKALLLAR